MQLPIYFPKNFLWGAATSAHQIEGNNRTSDWWKWEVRNAKTKTQKSKLKSWPNYILRNYPNPLQEENYISGKGINHWERFEEDFLLAKNLGHTAYRMSIEWARIEPRNGYFDEDALNHYRAMLSSLKTKGFTTFVGLHHFTNPLWFADRGGFASQEAPLLFAAYAKIVAEKLGGLIDFWITFNEPWVLIQSGYLIGTWPPQRHNPLAALRVFRTIIESHKAAYQAIKSTMPDARVGLVSNSTSFEPRDAWNPLDKVFAHSLAALFNIRIFASINTQLDFIGLNYYHHQRVSVLPPWFNNKNRIVSDLGWEIYPEGLYRVVKELTQFGLPIYVTENGVADALDQFRSRFIVEHLIWLHRAIQEGADVRGYLHWSLLDNFEWAYGFWPRFGLVAVDYKTHGRVPRQSAWLYRDIIHENGITNAMMDKYGIR